MQQSAEELGKDAAAIQALRVENMVLQVSCVDHGLHLALPVASAAVAKSRASHWRILFCALQADCGSLCCNTLLLNCAGDMKL